MQAIVKTPILGADLFIHFNLLVHMKSRTLTEKLHMGVMGIYFCFDSTGICTVFQQDTKYTVNLKNIKI